MVNAGHLAKIPVDLVFVQRVRGGGGLVYHQEGRVLGAGARAIAAFRALPPENFTPFVIISSKALPPGAEVPVGDNAVQIIRQNLPAFAWDAAAPIFPADFTSRLWRVAPAAFSLKNR